MDRYAHWIVFTIRCFAFCLMVIGFSVFVVLIGVTAYRGTFQPQFFPEDFIALGAAVAGVVMWMIFSDQNIRQEPRHQIRQTGKPAHHRIWD